MCLPTMVHVQLVTTVLKVLRSLEIQQTQLILPSQLSRHVQKEPITHRKEQPVQTSVSHAHQVIFAPQKEAHSQLKSVMQEHTVLMELTKRTVSILVSTALLTLTGHSGVHLVSTRMPPFVDTVRCAPMETSAWMVPHLSAGLVTSVQMICLMHDQSQLNSTLNDCKCIIKSKSLDVSHSCHWKCS